MDLGAYAELSAALGAVVIAFVGALKKQCPKLRQQWTVLAAGIVAVLLGGIASLKVLRADLDDGLLQWAVVAIGAWVIACGGAWFARLAPKQSGP